MKLKLLIIALFVPLIHLFSQQLTSVKIEFSSDSSYLDSGYVQGNVKVGTWKFYEKNDSENKFQLRSIETYSNGKKNGVFQYFDDENRKTIQGAYKNDRRFGVWEYFREKEVYDSTYFIMVEKEYYNADSLGAEEESPYKHESFYFDEELKSSYYYKYDSLSGKIGLHGKIIEGHQDEYMKGNWTLCYYDRGKKSGIFNSYLSGFLHECGIYFNDNKEGIWHSYHLNGEIATIAEYEAGEKIGEFYSYYQNGQLELYKKFLKSDSLTTEFLIEEYYSNTRPKWRVFDDSVLYYFGDGSFSKRFRKVNDTICEYTEWFERGGIAVIGELKNYFNIEERVRSNNLFWMNFRNDQVDDINDVILIRNKILKNADIIGRWEFFKEWQGKWLDLNKKNDSICEFVLIVSKLKYPDWRRGPGNPFYTTKWNVLDNVFVRKEFYEDHILIEVSNYKREVLHGEFIQYYPNGNIGFNGKYSNGIETGTWQYFNPKGTKKRLINYDKGDRYTMNDSLNLYEHFDHKNRLIGTGQIEIDKYSGIPVEKGIWQKYTYKGKKVEIIENVDSEENDEPKGECLYFDNNGNLVRKTIVENEYFILYDSVIKYYRNTNQVVEIIVKFSESDSISKSGFYKNGAKWYQEFYKEDLNSGPFISFYPSGAILETGAYLRGEKEGTWIDYNENGKTRNVEKFEDGESIFYQYYEYDEQGNLESIETTIGENTETLYFNSSNEGQ